MSLLNVKLDGTDTISNHLPWIWSTITGQSEYCLSIYQRAIRPILIIVWWLWWCTRRNWAQIGRDKPERTKMMLFLRVSVCELCSCGCLPSFRSCNRFSWPEKSSLVDMLTGMETDWPDFRGRWDRASCRSQLTNSPNSFSVIQKKKRNNICLQHFGQWQTRILLFFFF